MSKYTAPEEVIEMPGHCLACNAEAVTRVFQTSIPYFKVLNNLALFPVVLRVCSVLLQAAWNYSLLQTAFVSKTSR